MLTRESRLYTFATGATKTLHVSYNLSEPIHFALDMEQSTVLLLQWPIPGGAPQAGDGVYLWTLPAGSPVHISHATPPHASLTARYVVWDNPTTMRLDLYDRTTGQVISPWKPSCIRPALALDCPYVMCVDYQRNSAHLVQVPSGKDIPLGWAKAETQGAIAAGRAYWVPFASDAASASSTTIDYVDIPAQ